MIGIWEGMSMRGNELKVVYPNCVLRQQRIVKSAISFPPSNFQEETRLLS